MIPRIYIPADSGALALGAEKVATAIRAELAERGIEAKIVRNGSRGAYFLEPMVEVATAEGRVAYGPVKPSDVKSLFDCGFLNSVVSRDKLEEEVRKYATACSRSRPTDTVVAQKTFFEIYKQYRGEYMGARMTAWLEAMWPFMHHESDITEFTAELMDAGVNNAVKAAEMGYPPEWRMSLSGRRKG